MPAPSVLAALGTTVAGLSGEEAVRRLAADGPNVLPGHRATFWTVAGRQFANPVLLLLLLAAGLSFAIGDRGNAAIIGAIMLASTALGFVNEYRGERTAQALHSQVTHTATVRRGGTEGTVDVKDVVVGDLVRVGLGSIVPADLRILSCRELEADESVLTGESVPVSKSAAPVEPGAALADLESCLLMGSVIRHGDATAVVLATGLHAEFGRIAQDLGGHAPRTDFEVGLTRFSLMLLWIGLSLMAGILAINLLLQRPLIDSLLFSLAVAVGITPQLLPAVVSTSLAAGSRMLAREKVLVKRLISIEDIGNMDVLLTDKTGTLTDGRISFLEAVPCTEDVRRTSAWGLLCCQADPTAAGESGVGQNALDSALWRGVGPGAAHPADLRGYRRTGFRPFDHLSRVSSATAVDPSGHRLEILMGAPEQVLARCSGVRGADRGTLEGLFADGSRVVAVAVRDAADDDRTSLQAANGRPRHAGGTGGHTADRVPGDQRVRDQRADFRLAGYLVFLDRPKTDAAESLRALADLGVAVKVATGDNGLVAAKVCRDLGLTTADGSVPVLTGADVDALEDGALEAAASTTIVFARVSPEQKARIVRALRTRHAVGYLGDGVNDALALHQADVGISVDTGTDVAKDAADVVLLEKDLGDLARAVVGGRRIFANTIKYVLMGTSSNFGNMFSAAAASAFLPFLPMLPQQILLNNMLYDCSQLAIPTDRVDAGQLRRPAHWDIGQIRRFMFVFGPVSSLFDFATFALMLGVLHASPEQFRTGWFVESLATQTLIVFAIRTRLVPFPRSRPSVPLAVSVCAVVAAGAVLPFTPAGPPLGFAPLPPAFFGALAAMVVVYLVLIETAKHFFYRAEDAEEGRLPRAGPRPETAHDAPHRIRRRATGFARHQGATARVSYRPQTRLPGTSARSTAGYDASR